MDLSVPDIPIHLRDIELLKVDIGSKERDDASHSLAAPFQPHVLIVAGVGMTLTMWGVSGEVNVRPFEQA